MTRKIQITGCTDSMMWYVDKVGQSFELISDSFGEYLCRTDNGTSNVVRIEDGKIIDESAPS